MKRWQFIIAFLYALAALATVMAGTLVYWSATPVHVLVVSNNPVPVRPTELTPGSAVIMTYTYCKNTDTKGTVRTSLVSATSETFLPLAPDITGKQCHVKLDVPAVIPMETAAGSYHFHFRATYRINPLKTEIDEWNSQNFTVQ